LTDKRTNELDLFKGEDEIWRLRGRMGNAPIPYDTKHSMWLPRYSPLTNLMI